MIFESLEAAQREAAYLKCKTCTENSKAECSCCDSCKLYDLCISADCTLFTMDNPLYLIEKITGEKCEIIKPVSEMREEMKLYCDNQIPSCNSCIFKPIEYSDGYCLIRDCKKSDGLVKLLYEYYKKKMEEKA